MTILSPNFWQTHTYTKQENMSTCNLNEAKIVKPSKVNAFLTWPQVNWLGTSNIHGQTAGRCCSRDWSPLRCRCMTCWIQLDGINFAQIRAFTDKVPTLSVLQRWQSKHSKTQCMSRLLELVTLLFLPFPCGLEGTASSMSLRHSGEYNLQLLLPCLIYMRFLGYKSW